MCMLCVLFCVSADAHVCTNVFINQRIGYPCVFIHLFVCVCVCLWGHSALQVMQPPTLKLQDATLR